jgi:peptidyl-prolyl cis-trans isomerase C
VKAEKKARAEELRKELLAGVDFAALTKKHSDCPSKERGGDLGSFPRGQMVKPFEEAAFSQAVNEIGPIVATEFGFHLIQVLDRQEAQVMPLDKEAKTRITPYLEQQKQQGAFEGLVKRLKANANIVVYGQEAAGR